MLDHGGLAGSLMIANHGTVRFMLQPRGKNDCAVRRGFPQRRIWRSDHEVGLFCRRAIC